MYELQMEFTYFQHTLIREVTTTGKTDIRETLVVYLWMYEVQSIEARQVKVETLPAASINRADRDRNIWLRQPRST